MLSEHHIEQIALKMKQGILIKGLQPGERPATTFDLSAGDEGEAVCAYCVLHSFGLADVQTGIDMT